MKKKDCLHTNTTFNGWRRVCNDCKLDLTAERKRHERNTMIVLGVLALIVVCGIRLAYVKFVYHDSRCFFAECRIIKN